MEELARCRHQYAIADMRLQLFEASYEGNLELTRKTQHELDELHGHEDGRNMRRQAKEPRHIQPRDQNEELQRPREQTPRLGVQDSIQIYSLSHIVNDYLRSIFNIDN